MAKRLVGAALITTALALALVAWLVWRSDTEQVAGDQLTADLGTIFTGRPAEKVEPNRAGPIAAAGAASVLFVSGVVLVAVSPRSDA